MDHYRLAKNKSIIYTCIQSIKQEQQIPYLVVVLVTFILIPWISWHPKNQPFVIKPNNSKNHKTNDNGANPKLKTFYNRHKLIWGEMHSTTRIHHLKYE